MRRPCLLVAVLAAAICLAPALSAQDVRPAAAPPASAPATSKPIDLVLCLDTSNSMDGLIHAAKLGVVAAAGRANTKAGHLYCNERWDLVDRCKTDKNFDIAKIPVEELNDEMKKMTVEQRVKYVREMTEKRDRISKQIAELDLKRQQYIREELKKEGKNAQNAFDVALIRILCEQAEKKGLELPRE